MSIQVPRTIKPIAKAVEQYVTAGYPNVMMFDQVNKATGDKWFKACKCHELFHQDIDRYIGDVYSNIAYGGK